MAISGQITFCRAPIQLGRQPPGEPAPPPRGRSASDTSPPGARSASSRFSANARNTPFGNCPRYASKSAGFVLFTIDCQNRLSCSGVAGGASCAAADAAREVAGALRRVSVLLGQSLARPDLVLDAFAGWISSDVQDDALASLVDECKLHKRTVLQRSGAGPVFKGLGVAKRYCKTNVISNTFMQC